jgi:hypothetical protein
MRRKEPIKRLQYVTAKRPKRTLKLLGGGCRKPRMQFRQLAWPARQLSAQPHHAPLVAE